MKKALFLTNYPSPYRVAFFDMLGQELDTTVLYADRIEKKTHRSADWFVSSQETCHSVQLKKRMASFGGRDFCIDVLNWLKKDWDAIVLCGYSSPTVILAMIYLRLMRIPFWMEVDGGLIRQDTPLRYRIKRLLVSSAAAYLSSGKATTDYLVHYGAKREQVWEYPFTSLCEKDLLPQPVSREEKQALRQKLNLQDGKIILSIGQFIHRKGFDVLLKAADKLQDGADIYIVGGEPTEEYLQLCKDLSLTNVHFLGFMKKEKLIEYYKAADLFVLPTREDIWGLVINEAMAFGLPVVTTDRCVAGLELVEEGVTGYIVPVGDENALACKMNEALCADLNKMGAAALEKVRPYTIENMAKVHAEIFRQEI
ncbi:MAG: glycosyltransferase family 4 protein [Oscillospiraceae bacterium]|nr:glycosyltransferase family 4 protein [Oscillospiraceae bacterium]